MRITEITKTEFKSGLQDPRTVKIEKHLKKIADDMANDEQPFDLVWEYTKGATDNYGFYVVDGIARIPFKYDTYGESPLMDGALSHIVGEFDTDYYEKVLNVQLMIDENEPGRLFSVMIELL